MSVVERERWSLEVDKAVDLVKANSHEGIVPSQYSKKLNDSVLQLVLSTIELVKVLGKDGSEDIITKTLDTFRSLLSVVNLNANNSTYSVIASAFHLFNYLHIFSQMDDFLSSAQHLIKEDTTRSMYCMYHYYAGMTMLIKNKPSDALTHLTEAINYIPVDSPNYRKTLIPLIVLHLRKGEYPPQQLLSTHHLEEEFTNLILSVERGDVVLYENEIRKHEAFFIHHGLFLLVESLKLIVYRNLFDLVQKSLNTNKILYSAFQKALSVFGKTCSKTELEFIVANMVYKGLMKCQIYHQFEAFVLPPSNAFSYFEDK
ncbi:hypothetical protein ENUP19_0341G0012 [Entamoeba nuttalli]|uniref:PCI domain containing protein n=2 Tax=Entamoeba nuttalli TaxID=412467 RepID=K2GWF9_ENTNP|nr:PCI domain containing protein [Entamoeba nuttalli P19]EKE39563.1 PCI domain containing protein [Entamoeba nuttalli P19]|eukprot:XP_008858099.1 PCI domain containing protein [Entamoeba nuttalli P19]